MPLLSLFRPSLSALAALSALAGYAQYPSRHAPGTAGMLLAGVFLLAAGCSALNQVQERQTDARMHRTRRRPIPSGRLSAGSALALVILPLASALALLGRSGPPAAVFLSLFALLWYNGVYTPLKRLTPFAALPGAICGALPPLIGWTAAGGDPSDFRIVLFAGLIFLWQIPHFWFFALRHREDFQRAGLPTLFSRFTPAQVERLALLWVLSLSCATLLLLSFGLLSHPAARLLGLSVAAALAGGAGLKLAKERVAIPRGEYFGKLNLALLLIISSLLMEGFL